jgi:hypothetical protein
VIEQNGVKLFLDPISQQYVYGTVIDYVTAARGFKFESQRQPDVWCGSSFGVGFLFVKEEGHGSLHALFAMPRFSHLIFDLMVLSSILRLILLLRRTIC